MTPLSLSREFVIATHSSLVWLRLGGDWRVTDHALLAQGYHYGVATLGGEQEPATGFVAYRGGDSVAQQTDPALIRYERIADGSFRAVGSIPAGDVGDVHQLSCANGGIYFADTKHNTVVFQDLAGARRDTHVFGGVRKDQNHVNSVFPCGRQLLVMLHNLKRRESELALLTHDESGFRHERMFSLWDRNCHNVYTDGEALLYDASIENQLVVIDVPQDRVAARIDLNGVSAWQGHIKGLSVIDGHWLVGVSQHAERYERGSSMSCLVVIDATSHEIVTVIDLHLSGFAGPIGNVNEIRCLSGEERAERRAQPLPAGFVAARLARNDLFKLIRDRVAGALLAPMRRVRRRMLVGKV